MDVNKTEFYQQQIMRFKELKLKCQRPDRVIPIIEAYKDELEKLNGGLGKWYNT